MLYAKLSLTEAYVLLSLCLTVWRPVCLEQFKIRLKEQN